MRASAYTARGVLGRDDARGVVDRGDARAFGRSCSTCATAAVFAGAFYNSLVASEVGLGNAGFQLGALFGHGIVSRGPCTHE